MVTQKNNLALNSIIEARGGMGNNKPTPQGPGLGGDGAMHGWYKAFLWKPCYLSVVLGLAASASHESLSEMETDSHGRLTKSESAF